jgi:hypothetical protein
LRCPTTKIKAGAATAALGVLLALAPATAGADTCGSNTSGGIASSGGDCHPVGPAGRARLVNGMAIPPSNAPYRVKQVIWAANEIRNKPYVYGGGHRTWRSAGYDCSGAVSYALHGGRFLSSPLDSSAFMRWGRGGFGRWITVYANSGHAYAVIAGLRWDTSGTGGNGPRWSETMRSSAGYRIRHPSGY